MSYSSKIFLLLALALSVSFCAQTQTDVTNYSIESYTSKFTGGDQSFEMEAPPWVLKSGWYQYFFTSAYTSLWSSPVSLGSPLNQNIPVTNDQVTGHGPTWILASGNCWGHYYDPAYLNTAAYIYNYEWLNYHWRRNYNGIFSAHVIADPVTNQKILFAVSHGENKNEEASAYFYQNTVNPNKTINRNDPATYSGYRGSTYVDYGDAYHAFVNGNWIPYDAAHDWGATYLNDLGPIVWPAAGYLDQNNNNTSYGVRQPSSILYNGNLYIFVVDNSFDGTGGIKLVRCSTSKVRTTSDYQTWSAVNGWISSLPNGFTKEHIADFFKVRGPENTSLFAGAENTVRFAVAQFKDTDTFIGVELYRGADNATLYVAFRYSRDLIHWSGRTIIGKAAGWSTLNLRYPVFLSKDGGSNTLIDPDEFYVIGTTPVNKVINRIHFTRKSGAVTNSFPVNPCSTNPVTDPADNPADSSAMVASPCTTAMTTAISGTDIESIQYNPDKSQRENNVPDFSFSFFPNPSHADIRIKLFHSAAGEVNVSLFDLLGRQLRSEKYADQPAGNITSTFSMGNLPPGAYFISILSNGYQAFGKVIRN